MKIALIYDAVFPFTKGGGEKRLYEIGRGLAEKGHEIHFYGMKFWKGADTIKKNGMFYHGLCRPRPLYNKDGKRSMKEAIFFGINCLKLIKEDFDVIDCCSFPYFSLFSCKLVSVLKRKQLYSTWHEVWGKKYWFEYMGYKGYLGYLIEKLCVMLPDKIISVSDHTTNLLKTRLNSKKPVYTIFNGAHSSGITDIMPGGEESDILFAGRLVSYKNIDVLIKSVELIKQKKPDVKALIIGDGPEKNTLEKLAAKLGLEKNIRFTGFLENHDALYSLMKSSKVFVLPSSREGFGIVVIEANACGIPVITVNHKNNAAKDLVEEGKNGFVCQLDNEEISGKILELLNDGTDKKMEKYCIDLSKKYDWDKITACAEEVYLG